MGLSKPLLTKAIAPTCAIAFVCLSCLVSVLYVSEGNPGLKENNRWQKLDQEEAIYGDIKKLIADKSLKSIPEQARPRARELASIYRQQGKQEEAAVIYRMLWLASGNSSSFPADAQALASIYTDMGAYSSAVESYQKILQYDRARLPQSDPAIARDVNNLGQCYYTAGCGTSDSKLRKQYFVWAREQLDAAAKMAGSPGSPTGSDRRQSAERSKADQSIIESNQALVKMDLDNRN